MAGCIFSKRLQGRSQTSKHCSRVWQSSSLQQSLALTFCWGQLGKPGLVVSCREGIPEQVSSNQAQKVHADLLDAGVRVLQALRTPQCMNAANEEGAGCRPGWQALYAQEICNKKVHWSRRRAERLGTEQGCTTRVHSSSEQWSDAKRKAV